MLSSFSWSCLIVATCDDESELLSSVMREVHLDWESRTACSREVTVDSMVGRGLSPIKYADGDTPKLARLLPLLSFSGVKILSMLSLPGINKN